ncbi:MAG: stage II sporulation protein M [Anaerolineaceae bacterium]|nr:stage II sporulation protein M [Anaerolineaceae bacterium]
MKSSLSRQLGAAMIITRREVRDQFRDWRIIFPVLGLTVFFPFLMNFTAQQMLGFVNRYGAGILGERLVPFLLMIVGFFPISVSLVIALESFVGEKERGSIEPLLNTPLADWQLYLGKLVAATIPPLFSSFTGMAVYLVGLALVGVPIPELPLLVQIVALSIVQAVMMVSGAVVVSTQATSVRAANLLASFIIIPSAFLIQGESVVMFWGNYQTLWWAVFGLAVLSVLLVRVGLAHFQREELLGREIDVLNVRWMAGAFWQRFSGGAGNVRRWYTQTLPATLGELRLPILLALFLAVIGVWVGVQQVQRFYIPLDNLSIETLQERLHTLVQIWPTFSVRPVLGIWLNNVRVMAIAMLLGMFSFGIIGQIPLIATMAVSGYLFGLLSTAGLPVWGYLLFVLPHGVIEVPAAVIATAAVLRAGALIATPLPDKTVGEVWLMALADWFKVMIGLVLPLLLVAAMIEAWVTPQIVLFLFHQF